jgi:hypothetical protein
MQKYFSKGLISPIPLCLNSCGIVDSTYPRLATNSISLTFSAGISAMCITARLKFQKIFKYFFTGEDPYPFYTAFGEASGKGGAFM